MLRGYIASLYLALHAQTFHGQMLVFPEGFALNYESG